MSIIYGNGRFPIQPAKGLCRGCHGTVPKGRRSWCGDICYDRFEPKRVRYFCWQRDRAICFYCGVDAEKMRIRLLRAHKYPETSQYSFVKNGAYDREAFKFAFESRKRHAHRIISGRKSRIQKMKVDGWPYYCSRDWWEMDHIIPFSEGGLTVLENVRTLCILCHKKRTKKWHKDRREPLNQAQIL